MPHGDLGPAILLFTLAVIGGTALVCAVVSAILTTSRLLLYKRRRAKWTDTDIPRTGPDSGPPAKTAMILGLVALVAVLPLSIAAVVYAHVALRRMEQQGHDPAHYRHAVIGLATGTFGITLILILAGAYVHFCVI